MKRRKWRLLVILSLLFVGSGWLIFREMRQRNLDRALIAAIKANDTSRVQTLLRDGASANAQDTPPSSQSVWRVVLDAFRRGEMPQGRYTTALNVALKWTPVPSGRGTLQPVGSNGNHIVPATTPYKVTFLPENTEIVTALLDHGADVNAKTLRGYTPLLYALAAGKHNTARILLDRGANINAKGGFDDTPLNIAIKQNDLAMAKLLLDRGADANRPKDVTAFGGKQMDVSSLQGFTPLTIAVDTDSAAMVSLLIAYHADVNREGMGTSPLSVATQSHKTKIVALLKQAGARK